jgi:helix-turn-helix resolvase-like protein
MDERRPYQPTPKPEQTQPLQGRATGRESLQGPTTVDRSAHEGGESTRVQPHKGRKKSLSPAAIEQLQERLTTGLNKAQVARELGISRQTLYQYLRGGESAQGDSERTNVQEPQPESEANTRLLSPEERREKQRRHKRQYRKDNKDKVNVYQRRYYLKGARRPNEKLREYQWQRHLERMAKRREQELIEQSADLINRGQEQHEVTQIFPSPTEK